jgi:hypothetical protein
MGMTAFLLRADPSLNNAPCLSALVTFEKVTVTFFVTFFSPAFPKKNAPKCQMLLCYLFWKGIPNRCAPTSVKVVGPLLTLFPDTHIKIVQPAARKPGAAPRVSVVNSACVLFTPLS